MDELRAKNTRHCGIVLAAGRGSRLGELTDSKPKCLVELGGRPLLDWQIKAMRDAGVEEIRIVTGYRSELIEARGVQVLHNPNWSRTSMVGSLMCALDRLPGPFLVSYSDIVYDSILVERLLASEASLAITYDTRWLHRWRRRFDDPLSDAERFRIDDDHRVREIGGKATSVESIQGQFMGLLKLSQTAAVVIAKMLVDCPELRATLDTTGLLNALITSGQAVHGVATAGGWCEIDDCSDLTVAEALLAEGALRNPWEIG